MCHRLAPLAILVAFAATLYAQSAPVLLANVVNAVVARVKRPHLRESMLTGWGTFLAPAAQRGKAGATAVCCIEWLGKAMGELAAEIATRPSLGLARRLLRRRLA